jgi:hypothetical protein
MSEVPSPETETEVPGGNGGDEGSEGSEGTEGGEQA